MTVLLRQFHSRELGVENRDAYSIARDTDSGRVFVRHEWKHPAIGASTIAHDISVHDFLAGNGLRQDALLAMIGTLVTGPTAG
jgi:hypothetical protein